MDYREEKILELLRMHGRAQFSDLAGRLGVSEETIRRDTKKLASRGTVVSIRGGVAMPEVLQEAAFHHCMLEQADSKRQIGERAAQLVNDGDTIIITGGSTTVYFAYELRNHANLTVITNSADISRLLVSRVNNTIYTIGGKLDPLSASALGPAAVADLKRYAADKVFTSPAAISPTHGFMHESHDEVEFIRTAITSSDHSVMLCDYSKFDARGNMKLCGLDEIDVVVTDREPSNAIETAFQDHGVELIVEPIEPAEPIPVSAAE